MFCGCIMLYFGKNPTKHGFVVRVNIEAAGILDMPDRLKIERGDSMGELYNPFPKLPKNIRQIGDTDQVVRLYVEDYVNTYLKRLYPAGNQTLRVGLLLGSTENYDGTPVYLYRWGHRDGGRGGVPGRR